MVFWGRRFSPKNERKQVDLRYHSSKVEFFHSFFGGNRRQQEPFRNFLTFKKEPKSDDHLSKFDWHDLSPIFLAIMLLHNLKVF